LLVGGCDTGPAPSLYDPDAESAPAPVIDSIEPSGSALAGVDILTFTGQNFSANPSDNLVYFDDTRGEVLEASPTQLRVRPPNLPRPELQVRVAVLEAEDFSNSVSYRLDPAAERFSDIKGFEEPFAITSDAEGNIYVSLFSGGSSVGIKKIAPDGTRSDFVETTFKWDALAFGPDGLLYAARGVRAIFRLPEGGSQETIIISDSNADRLTALAFDAQGNLWVGGNAVSLFRLAPDGSVAAFPFQANVRDLAVFDGFLYAVGSQDGTSKVWRFPLNSDGTLGAAEEYFDVTAALGADALALAVATNGDVFVGTNADDPVIVIAPDRTAEVLYPDIMEPAAISFAWGAGTSLYMTQGVTSATTPDLIRIETRRQGAR